MLPRVSRGKIVTAVIFVVIIFLFALLRMDLDLPNLIASRSMPDIVVEKLKFVRTIRGREWEVAASDAESEDNVIKVRSIDINVREQAAKRTSALHASSGEFQREDSKLLLRDVYGSVYLEDRSVDVAASLATYRVSEDLWEFPEGIRMNDDEVSVTGSEGRIDADGVFSIRRGARARWTIK
jgi:hypothetical protein